MSPQTAWSTVVRSCRLCLFAVIVLILVGCADIKPAPAPTPAPNVIEPPSEVKPDQPAEIDRPDERNASPKFPGEEEEEGKAKPDHPGDAVLFRRLTLQDENGVIPFDGLIRAVDHAKAMAAYDKRSLPDAGGIGRNTWTWLGPGNIGGRIRTIVISPTNASKMWVGGVSGGIWTTSNGGTTWQVVGDFMANLAVSTMVMNPVTPSIMYAGTGEGFYNLDGIQGAGVFKSIDSGVTWSQLSSTNNTNWYYTNRLAISPDGATVLAATRSGLWRTITGGTSWTRVMITETLDVKFHPSDSTKAIAGGWGGGAYYSADGGATWTPASGIPSGSDRVELAYAPSSPTTVYASVDRNTGEVYRSANGGQSYSLVNTGYNYLSVQGWYDNVIWVDPTISTTLVVGGIDLWRSINGGTTLTQISQWFNAPSSAHADHHAIVNDPNFNGTSNRTVFFGNDGGIYKAANVYTVVGTTGWQELNNNLGITQFYGAAGNTSSGVIVGGTQDNGTLRYSGGTETWTTMFGGDGGFDAADQTNSNYFYGEYVYLCIHRSSDAGVSADYICGQYWNGVAWAWKADPYRIPDAQNGQANFIAPFVLDPNNANRLLGGGYSLWRTNDAKTVNTNSTGPSWASIKASIGSPISAIAVAPGNSDIIWVGHNNGNVYTTTNGTAITPTWTRVDANSPGLPNRFVTRLTIEPNNSQIVYATFGGFSPDNVWRTTNGGSTWTDITGSGVTGLPDAPVRSLVVNPYNSNWLYVGTEVGIFASEDGGATWGVPHDGPANVSVDELFWLNNNTLVAATHGRGLYKSQISAGLSYVSQTRSEVAGNGNGAVDPGETIGLYIGLMNNGAVTASNVTSTIKIVSGNATLVTPASAYPNISAGATQTNTTQFKFQVSPSQPCGNPLTIVFSATYNITSTFVYTFDVPIGAATAGITTTYTSTDVPKSIPDNDPNGINSTLTISAAGIITDIDARINSVTHTWDSDLVFKLTSPTGISITLINRRGSGDDNFVNTVLDDNAATPIASGTAPFTGRYQPEEALAAYNTNPISGVWTLNVSDVATSDTGTLNAWSLDVRPVVYACTPYGSTPTVQFSSATYSVNEGAGTATITATLSAAAASNVNVNYATSNGTAIAPGDYISTSGTLTFTPGITQATFTVPIVNDSTVEGNETFSVTLSNPANATLGAPSNAIVTIIDNDVPTVQFNSATYNVNEGAGTATITATLSAAAASNVNVNYATSNGTAVAPGDYISTSGTLTFTPGITQATFTVPIVNDSNVEGNETFSVTLSNPVNATLGAPSNAIVTIIDNDVPTARFNSAAYNVNEGAGTATITVTLNTSSPLTATVNYATSDGTAIAPGDYTSASGTLTFTPGSTSATFTVPIVDDSLDENNETINLALSSPGGATLGAPNTAVLTIADNDPPPSVQFDAVAYSVNEGDGATMITVTLSTASGLTATVNYATTNGTAIAPGDYITATGTLTFAPGTTSAAFTIAIVDDALIEANEILTVTLSAPNNATLGAPNPATLTIIDNDRKVYLPLVME